MKVLIVDDSRATQTIIHRQIQRLGYSDIEFQKSDNGQDALNVIRTWEPDLIISDWHMPEMSGIELLAILKQEMLGINLGFVTSESSEERLKEAKNHGARFIIQKPFDSDVFEKTLQPFFDSYYQQDSTPEEHSSLNEKKHIILPHLDKLQERLNHLGSLQTTLTKAPPLLMEEKYFPYLIGLYSNKDRTSVHAVAIADIRTIGIFGRLTRQIPKEQIQHTLNSHKVSQAVFEQGKHVLQFVESTLYNTEISESLILRDAKLLKTPAEHIQKLLDKNKKHRLDTWVNIPGYKPGNLTIIVS